MPYSFKLFVFELAESSSKSSARTTTMGDYTLWLNVVCRVHSRTTRRKTPGTISGNSSRLYIVFPRSNVPMSLCFSCTDLGTSRESGYLVSRFFDPREECDSD